MNAEKKHIFIIGPSGVGKTTIAKQVAQDLGIDFFDLDVEIANKLGCTISQYFESHGEAAFRKAERDVLLEACSSQKQLCIATGGGSVLDALNIYAMKNSGVVIFLNAQVKDIISRVENDPTNDRPLLKGNLEEVVKDRYVQRLGAYELASDISIGTSNRDIEAVVEAVIRQYERYVGNSVDIGSQVLVGSGLIKDIAQYFKGYKSLYILTQESIPKQYLETFTKDLDSSDVSYHVIIVPEGEEAKSFKSYETVLNKLAELKANRSSAVIALGGGVVGDLTGFVGSTFMRGVDVIQIPSTLLAQVDSSIGGKCGINISAGKNMVGTITQPKMIISDIDFLTSLPENDYLSGLGEVVKYALLGNLTVKELIENNSKEILERDVDVLTQVIKSCMNHKIHIVSRDPFERNGLRATLNLGHTLAHALEKVTDFKIAHGQAVVLGIRFICDLSLELKTINSEQYDEYISLIDSLNLYNQLPSEAIDAGAQKLVEHMYGDKKSDGALNLVLFQSEGGAKLVNDLDETIVVKVLNAFINSKDMKD